MDEMVKSLAGYGITMALVIAIYLYIMLRK